MSTDATSVPCRVGTKRMLEIVNRICEGRGSEADVDRLVELGETIKETSLCGLGQTAPNPVLSTIRHFGYEYVEHIRDKRCRSGVCPALVHAPCESACPANVDIPGYVSLVAENRYAEALRLHRERNPFAAVCSRVCFHTCEDAEGITDALSFLRTCNLRGSVPVGKNVAVGGGNSAIDAARTALRLGAEKVTVAYRRAREAMPAYEEEIEEAEHEGVVLKLLTAPIEVVVEGKRVAGVKCLPMRLGEFDRSGRRRPEEAGDAFVIPADHVLVAIGQTLDLKRICNDVAIQAHGKEFIHVNPVTGQTSEKWIFAGGDADPADTPRERLRMIPVQRRRPRAPCPWPRGCRSAPTPGGSARRGGPWSSCCSVRPVRGDLPGRGHHRARADRGGLEGPRQARSPRRGPDRPGDPRRPGRVLRLCARHPGDREDGGRLAAPGLPRRVRHQFRRRFDDRGGGPRAALAAPHGPGAGKGDRSNLCEAPSGPFRQIGPVPFSGCPASAVFELLAGLDQVRGALPPRAAAESLHLQVAAADVRGRGQDLGNARRLIAAVRSGRKPYHFIEVMTCPGGCIGGGGQPRFTDNRVREARIAAIYKEDEGKRLRKSHENPEIQELYREFLGRPLGETPHRLLHTRYTPRQRT